MRIESDDEAGVRCAAWRKTIDTQVLALTEDNLIAVNARNHSDFPRCMAVRFSELDAWSIHLQLLFGAVEFLASGKRHERLRFVFNTVGWRHVEATLTRLGHKTMSYRPTKSAHNHHDRHCYPNLPLKFQYHLNSMFLPGEQILALVYQNSQVHKVYRWKSVSIPGWVLVHTSDRLVVLHEPQSASNTKFGVRMLNILPRSYGDLVLREGKNGIALEFSSYDGMLRLGIEPDKVSTVAEFLLNAQYRLHRASRD